MELEFLINRMARQAEAIQALALGVSDVQARWKPDPQSWSILEVINHLYDEECSDFRIRLDIILHHPGQAFPPINPQGWVSERGYNQRDLTQSVDNFLAERQKSLAWLHGLSSPDWQAFVTAPFGNLSAGDMAAAWTAHDLLHLRQLVELHWAFTQQSVQPYQVKYAGEW
ncbi:MAG TPA: DinB family protein [Anaerolineales bacterium]|nr:DinB family protein [Anaerolineales bacterium]